MSQDNFEQCLDWLLEHEGGFVNHPADPGGMTNLGVTKTTYDLFYGGDATEEVMRNLTRGDVAPIYRREYWLRSMCDDLPSGVDWMVFDWGVNSGPGRVIRKLQEIVKSKPDGIIGPQTLRKITMEQPRDLIEALWARREEYYRSLRTFDSFGRGWVTRNNTTKMQALGLAL